MDTNRIVAIAVFALAIHACSPNRAELHDAQSVTRNDSLQALVAGQEINGDINESIFHFVITCATGVDDGAVLTVDRAVLPSVADSLDELGREIVTMDPPPPMTMAIPRQKAPVHIPVVWAADDTTATADPLARTAQVPPPDSIPAQTLGAGGLDSTAAIVRAIEALARVTAIPDGMTLRVHCFQRILEGAFVTLIPSALRVGNEGVTLRGGGTVLVSNEGTAYLWSLFR